MRSFSFFAAAALAVVASAASTENAFNNPEGGYKFTAGKSTTLKWSPDTDGTVSLRLQTGKTTTSTSGTEIASNIKNSGSYTWDVPSDLVEGREYTIEIISDEDENSYNFSPNFTVDGATGSGSSTAAPSSTASSAASTTPASTSAEVTSTPSSSRMSTPAKSSSRASTMSRSATPASSSAASTSTSSSTSDSDSSSGSGSGSGSASGSSSSQSSTPTTNAAASNQVSGGVLALFAGALALL